jgi:transforming growth factor-beta-induced protein
LDNDTEAIRALLEYHILNGTHPSASFGLQPLFAPTLLNNPNYTNVTGGQVVELAALNNVPTIVSGVKAASHIVEAVSIVPSDQQQASC